MKKKSGFSIIELLFLVAVVAIVAVGVTSLSVLSFKTKVQSDEFSKMVFFTNMTLDGYVAQAKNDKSNFWYGLNSIGERKTENGADDKAKWQVIIDRKQCSQLCAVIGIGITWLNGNLTYKTERYVNSLVNTP